MQQTRRRDEVTAALDVPGTLELPGGDPLQRVIGLAAALTGRPMAAVRLIGSAEHAFAAAIGLSDQTTPAGLALCRLAMSGPSAGTEVADTRLDDRLDGNPLFADNGSDNGTDEVRAYAGLPLVASDGSYAGALCVLDTAPGTLDPTQWALLQTLAEVAARSITDRTGEDRLLLDVAARREAEIGLREAQSALDGIITVDGDERIVSWNEGAARLLGHDRSAALGKDLSLIVPAAAHEAHTHGFARLHHGGEPRLLGKMVELEAVTADGSLVPIELSLSRWYRGDEPFYTAVVRDISERKRYEAERGWRASHDPATGLLNATELGLWYEQHCAPLVEGRLRAVFCIQLTNLSSISAAIGVEASERLLKQIGDVMGAAARDDLIICHLRDTHFAGAVVLEPDPHPDTLDTRLRAIARDVVKAGTGPFVVDDVQIEMHVQIGVVATRRTDLTFLELLRQAEIARDSSARQINVADEVHVAGSPATVRDLAVLSDLYDSVTKAQFELHYQPLTPLQPQLGSFDDLGRPQVEPHRVEALIRWRHPERGLVPPGQFIPLIENSRLIDDVTTWVLRTALEQQVRWRDRNLDVRIAVNVSPQVLLNNDVVAMVSAALRETGARADRLKIEITESAIVEDPDQAREMVRELHRLGVNVSIDDFGTGYTSLRLLRDLEVRELKLDRLFVASATDNPADAAIANAVGQLGQRLGIKTVAEGIEDVETRSLFRAFGYDYMQGFLDSRPLPSDQIEQWLRDHDPQARLTVPARVVSTGEVPRVLAR